MTPPSMRSSTHARDCGRMVSGHNWVNNSLSICSALIDRSNLWGVKLGKRSTFATSAIWPKLLASIAPLEMLRVLPSSCVLNSMPSSSISSSDEVVTNVASRNKKSALACLISPAWPSENSNRAPSVPSSLWTGAIPALKRMALKSVTRSRPVISKKLLSRLRMPDKSSPRASIRPPWNTSPKPCCKAGFGKTAISRSNPNRVPRKRAVIIGAVLVNSRNSPAKLIWPVKSCPRF